MTQTAYKIVKGYSATSSGREVAVWHVVDTKDGYIFDTFSLKRDAQHWVDQATKGTPE